MVYGISPLSPLHLAGAAGVMVAVTAAATLVPVWRATAVDPLEALREE
jgi:ABC-type lipoprotein release transport system permease subunit